jgi:hypothetical protein
MQNSNVKVIYSLRIHVALQQMGINYLTEMKNPKNTRFNCWVYEETPGLKAALNKLMGGGQSI